MRQKSKEGATLVRGRGQGGAEKAVSSLTNSCQED